MHQGKKIQRSKGAKIHCRWKGWPSPRAMAKLRVTPSHSNPFPFPFLTSIPLRYGSFSAMLPLFSSDIIWKESVRRYGLKKNHTNSLDKNQLDSIERQSRRRVKRERRRLFPFGEAFQQGQAGSRILPLVHLPTAVVEGRWGGKPDRWQTH